MYLPKVTKLILNFNFQTIRNHSEVQLCWDVAQSVWVEYARPANAEQNAANVARQRLLAAQAFQAAQGHRLPPQDQPRIHVGPPSGIYGAKLINENMNQNGSDDNDSGNYSGL